MAVKPADYPWRGSAVPAGGDGSVLVGRMTAAGRLATLGWSAIESAARQFLSLACFFVSVRFLAPGDLGGFALAVALNAVPSIFIDEIIGESLVQMPDATELDWNTGFTANLIVALICLLVSCGLAWPLARLFHAAYLLWAIPLLSTASLVGALGNIQRAYLARGLQYRSIAKTSLISQTAGGLATVALAAAGFGSWALIDGLCITTAISSAIYWHRSPWRPRLRLARSTLRSRLSYGGYLTAVRVIYLLRDQSPLLIAGFLTDVAHVGFLSLGLRVARSVGQMFEDVTARPLLSLMSREQHDPARFAAVLAEVITVVGSLALPSFIGMAIVGPRLLPLIFGAHWAPAGAVLPWLCIVIGCGLLLHITAVALRARALGLVATKLTASAVLIDVMLLAVLTPFSLEWALIGWAARGVLFLPVVAVILRTSLGMSVRGLMMRLLPALVGSVMMGGLVGWLDLRFACGHSVAGIALMIGAGATCYGGVVGGIAKVTKGKQALLF